MKNSSLPRRVHWLLVAAVALLLNACAGTLAHHEGLSLLNQGKTDEALARLEEASKAAPDNMEFKLHFVTAREKLISALLASARLETTAGRFDEATERYKKVQQIDPANAQAAAGLLSVEQARQQTKLLSDAEALLNANDIDAASDKLARILKDNPRHPEAIALQRRIEEKTDRAQTLLPSLRKAFKKPITLEFRDASLKQVVEALSRHSGINAILDKDVPGNLQTTVFLRQVGVGDAIEVILSTHQLARRIVNDNTIMIYPNTAAKHGDYQDLLVKVFYLANTDAKQVMAMLKTILKMKNVFVDEKINMLVVRDTPDAIQLAERLIAAADVHEAEVMLEVEVIEVKRSRLTNLGINYPDQLVLAPLPTSGTSLTLTDLKNLNSDRIGATLTNTTINAHADVGDTNILANPRIRTKNHEKATIKIGDRVPVITTTTSSSNFVSENVQYVDVGLKLEVEPSIYPDDEISIKLSLDVSSVVREIVSKAGSLSYQIGGRNASTVLRLKNGETQILGGLISDEQRMTANRVPGLGDFPVLGRLFSSQKDDNQKTELVLSITPRLINSLAPPSHVPREFWTGTENTLRSKSLGGPAGTSGKEGAKSPASPKLATPAVTSSTTLVQIPAPAAASGPATAIPQEVPQETGDTPVTPNEAPAQNIVLQWEGKGVAKTGETFVLALKVSSAEALSGLPVQIKYDPNVLEAVEAKPGDFMGQKGAKVDFSQKIMATPGMVFVANSRVAAEGAKGEGELITLAFRALKPAERTIVSLFPATPIAPNKAALRQTAPALIGISITP